jgi:hypothetical protein
MAAIDIGVGAGTATAYTGAPSMELDRGNPANDTGVLDTVIISIRANTTTINKVGTFSGSGTDWASRDYAQLGTLNAGVRTITGLSIDVVANDILGHYLQSGSVYFYNSGKTGLCYITGMADRFDGNTYTYNVAAQSGLGLDIYATGETVAAGGGALVGGSALVGGQILCGNGPLIN